MPNGGSDCCGNCLHNRAVQEGEHPNWAARENRAQCTLRHLDITNPFWTYCGNWDDGHRSGTVPTEPAGWVYSRSLYEGYQRIPWHGDIEPIVSVPCVCAACDRATDEGIVIEHGGAVLGFCTNRHYVDWWKTQHDDPSVSSGHLATPEEFYDKST